MHTVSQWSLVVFMTCLIWIAADQRASRMGEVNVPFEVKSAVPGAMDVSVIDSDLRSIKIKFRGPSRKINQLKNSQDIMGLQFEVSDRGSGRWELDVMDLLGTQLDRLPIAEGLFILSADPLTIPITVDRYVEREVRLIVDPSDVEFEGQPQLDPAVVRVRVLERQFQAGGEDQGQITIPLGDLFENEAKGKLIRKTVPVPTKLDSGPAVRDVEPAEVTLQATLHQHLKTDRLPTVPIMLMVTKEIADGYLVRFEGQGTDLVTRAVLIRGPADAVKSLVENVSAYDVAGYIKVTREDLPLGLSNKRTIIRVPRFTGWPAGVSLAEEPEPVEFSLVRRN